MAGKERRIDNPGVNPTRAGDVDIAEQTETNRAASTRDRLLQTGGRLFAEQGFHAVSVRAIVSKAGVNLGAINYHFGSKQALFEEIFAEGASQIIAMRMKLLDNCRAGSDRPPLLEQILTAYLAPGLVYNIEHPDIAEFQRIRARIITEDSDLAHRLLSRHFRPSTQRFMDMLATALPELPRNLLLWRYQTLIATVVYAGSSWGTIHSAPDTDTGADGPQALNHLVPLMAALFHTEPDNQPGDAVAILEALQDD